MSVELRPSVSALTWRQELARAFSSVAELLAELRLDEMRTGVPQKILADFPLRVPRGYVSRMRKGDAHDPLLRQVLPLRDEALSVPGYGIDPVGDLASARVRGVLQKYHGRALLMVTGACAVHCRYCFRRAYPYHEATLPAGRIDAAIAELMSDESIEEVILSGGDPLSLTDLIRREVLAVDPDQPVYSLRTMESLLADSVRTQRVSLLLLGLFALLALGLASVGIYGVISYSVSQRSHEIGIRMALGAQPRDILALVVRDGIGGVTHGLLLGLGAAFGLTRFLSTLLYEIAPTDPATFAGVSLVLAAVALLACYIPARRATRVDPIVALRYE